MDRASIVRAGGQTRARFRRLNRTCSGAPPSPPGRWPFASMKAWFVFAALLSTSLPAAAQWANIVSDVNMREGPEPTTRSSRGSEEERTSTSSAASPMGRGARSCGDGDAAG